MTEQIFLFDELAAEKVFKNKAMSGIQKNAVEICKKCRKFNGLKKDGSPKACKLKRNMGVIQCRNRAAALGYRS